jgi:hypothetical protein
MRNQTARSRRLAGPVPCGVTPCMHGYAHARGRYSTSRPSPSRASRCKPRPPALQLYALRPRRCTAITAAVALRLAIRPCWCAAELFQGKCAAEKLGASASLALCQKPTDPKVCARVSVCLWVCACVRACVRASVRLWVCVCVRFRACVCFPACGCVHACGCALIEIGRMSA